MVAVWPRRDANYPRRDPFPFSPGTIFPWGWCQTCACRRSLARLSGGGFQTRPLGVCVSLLYRRTCEWTSLPLARDGSCPWGIRRPTGRNHTRAWHIWRTADRGFFVNWTSTGSDCYCSSISSSLGVIACKSLGIVGWLHLGSSLLGGHRSKRNNLGPDIWGTPNDPTEYRFLVCPTPLGCEGGKREGGVSRVVKDSCRAVPLALYSRGSLRKRLGQSLGECLWRRRTITIDSLQCLSYMM